jgi:hypothetical protein
VPTDLPVPFEFYDEYDDELEHFPDRVRDSLRTFLLMAGFDPQDEGLLSACRFEHGYYVYPLADNYYVYWTMVTKTPRHVTFTKPRVLYVRVVAIEQQLP